MNPDTDIYKVKFNMPVLTGEIEICEHLSAITYPRVLDFRFSKCVRQDEVIQAVENYLKSSGIQVHSWEILND